MTGSKVHRSVLVVVLIAALAAACGDSASSGRRPLAPPDQVANPSPADGAIDVPVDAFLSWDAAAGAASYDVYFGTSPPGTFLGNIAGTSVFTGPHVPATQYYWRIDSVNNDGTTTGAVWTFTTVIPPPRGEDHTLVIENLQSPISQAIAAYYLNLRPAARLFSVDVVAQETVNRATFDADIRDPIEAYLVANGIEDDIWYIVTTKGVPLRISGASGGPNDDERSSVDSELTHLLRPFSILRGWQNNPYYGAQVQFERPTYDMYLVCRLTGYETDNDLDGIPDDVKDLIDRGVNPVPGPTMAATGQFVLDEWPPRGTMGNDWMQFAASDLQAGGFTVLHDQTNTFLIGESNVIGYASWGSNDGDNNTPPYTSQHQYIAGALVTTYVSTNARSFQTGTTYGQSLVADLIREGVTGANGHVYEPYLDAVSRPHFLFERYAIRGWSLADSYYSSIRFISWMNVVVGDPICAPWAP